MTMGLFFKLSSKLTIEVIMVFCIGNTCRSCFTCALAFHNNLAHSKFYSLCKYLESYKMN